MAHLITWTSRRSRSFYWTIEEHRQRPRALIESYQLSSCRGALASFCGDADCALSWRAPRSAEVRFSARPWPLQDHLTEEIPCSTLHTQVRKSIYQIDQSMLTRALPSSVGRRNLGPRHTRDLRWSENARRISVND